MSPDRHRICQQQFDGPQSEPETELAGEHFVVRQLEDPMLNPPPEQSHFNKFSVTTIRVLAVIAASIAAYLTWVTLTHGTVAACGDQSTNLGCDDVLRSPWSRVVGIPVSLLGLVVYAAILATSGSLVRPSQRVVDRPRFCCLSLITVASGAAIWFVFLQVFLIGHLCLFCITIHLCGVMIEAIVLTAVTLDSHRARRRSDLETIRCLTIGKAGERTPTPNLRRQYGYISSVLTASCGVLLLIGVQVIFPAKTYELVESLDLVAETPDKIAITSPSSTSELNHHAARESNDSVLPQEETPAPTTVNIPLQHGQEGSDAKAPRHRYFLKGRLKIDVREHCVLGSSEANQVVIELVDYTCPDCRRLHQHLKAARQHFGDRLAIVVFPTPLETSCNHHIRSTHKKHVGACKFANLALSVFSVAPDKFATFHDWLMEPTEPPSFDQALRRARMLVESGDGLGEASGKLQHYIKFFNVVNVQRLPAVIVGDKVMVGVPATADRLIEMLETQL